MQSQRGPWIDLVVNVAAPTAVLMLLSSEDRLGPVWGLVLALAFPVGHAVATLVSARRVSFLAGLAVVSVLLTGGIGILELPVSWFAWKEALFPLAMGIGCVGSTWTPWPALPALLNTVLDSDRVQQLLEQRGAAAEHARALRRGTWQLGLVCSLTAAGTFAFARYMVTSPTGTEAFNAELGRYTGLSFVVIGIPSTVLLMLVLRAVLAGLEARTGASIDDLLKGGAGPQPSG